MDRVLLENASLYQKLIKAARNKLRQPQRGNRRKRPAQTWSSVPGSHLCWRTLLLNTYVLCVPRPLSQEVLTFTICTNILEAGRFSRYDVLLSFLLGC